MNPKLYASVFLSLSLFLASFGCEATNRHVLIANLLKEGDQYYYGTSTSKPNHEEALKRYQRSADLGGAEAQTKAGHMLWTREASEEDLEKAFNYLTKAKQQKYEWGTVVLAELYVCDDFKGKDPNQTFLIYSELAESGSHYAKCRLGELIMSGVLYPDLDETAGEFKRYEMAIPWLQQAADTFEAKNSQTSFLIATYNLARCQYILGEYEKAKQNFECAKEYGPEYIKADASFGIALCLYDELKFSEALPYFEELKNSQSYFLHTQAHYYTQRTKEMIITSNTWQPSN